MASLTIRNLPEDVKSKLRIQAAHNGTSLEAHARDILQQAAVSEKDPVDIVKAFQDQFGGGHGVDLELASRESDRPVPDFE